MGAKVRQSSEISDRARFGDSSCICFGLEVVTWVDPCMQQASLPLDSVERYCCTMPGLCSMAELAMKAMPTTLFG